MSFTAVVAKLKIRSIVSITHTILEILTYHKRKTKYTRDDRIQFSQWKDLKAKVPHGTLPVMTIDDGDLLTQSGAMLRYAASLDTSHALYPPSNVYAVEEAMGIVGDFIQAWSPCLYLGMRPTKFGYPEGYNQTDEGKALIQRMRTEFTEGNDCQLGTYLRYLSDLIDKNGETYLCGGDTPTIADCLAVPAIRNFTRGHIDHVQADCIKTANPSIVQYVERFCAHPRVKGRYTTGIGI